MCVTLRIDTRELQEDLERIESGELKFPTVSAIHVSCDGVFEEEIPVWLEEL